MRPTEERESGKVVDAGDLERDRVALAKRRGRDARAAQARGTPQRPAPFPWLALVEQRERDAQAAHERGPRWFAPWR